MQALNARCPAQSLWPERCWPRLQCLHLLPLLLFCLVVGAGSPAQAQGQPPNANNPEDSAIWQKLRANLFQARPIVTERMDVIALQAPARAEDAAIVPIAIRARFPQTPERFIDKVYLVIDNNPSPLAATFHFTQLSGRADLETRVRIEQYTFVRAIAEANDGTLYMATRFVKASGGCSAPPAKDPQAALANLGRMRLQVQDPPNASQPVLVQLMVNHPNNTGLVMDQLTRLYAPAHYLRALRVTLDGAPVLSAELDISISENPNFRFYVFPRSSGELSAEVEDSNDLRFLAYARLERPAAPGTTGGSGPQTAPGVSDHPDGDMPVALQLASGVYLLPGAQGDADVRNQGRIGNVGFIVGDEGVVVVNTGTSYHHGQLLLQAIRRVTDKPVLLAVVTHTRPEFLLGAAAFQAQGIPVHMHHQAAELMRSRCERCLKKLQALLGLQAMQGSVIFQPNLEFEESYAMRPAGRAIRVLYFGYSSGPGDVAVLDEQTGVLFAGGLLDNQRIPDVQDGDLAGWVQALHALRAMPLQRIVPGHGAPGGLPMVNAEERYLLQLQDRVATLLQQGRPLQDIADAASLGDFADWDGYDTVHQRNAAAVYLRLERAKLLAP